MLKYFFHKTIFSLPTLFVVNHSNKSAILKANLLAASDSDYQEYTKEFKGLQIKNTDVATASSIPVLLYHGIIKPDKNGKVTLGEEDISLDLFKKQMIALKENGYKTITIDEFEKFIQGKITLPSKSFLLTFDDGIKNSFYPADPILHALGFNAVMYVITVHSVGQKESPYYLDQSELEMMVKSGRWSLQSHGKNDHSAIVVDSKGTKGSFMTNKMWLPKEKRLETEKEFEDRVYTDMINSKKDLETNLHTRVTTYAFPRGDYGTATEVRNTVLRIVSSVYNYYFIQFRPDQRTGYYRDNYPDPNNKLLRRIKMYQSVSVGELLADMQSGKAKSLPFTASFNSNNQDWISNTNDNPYFIKPNTMVLQTNSASHNTTLYLDGSYLWQNYQYSATVKVDTGKSVGLVARAFNGIDFYMCAYKQNSIKLEEFIDGEPYLIHDSKSDFKFNLAGTMNLGIRVDGNVISCLVNNGVTVRSYGVKEPIANGGIGINLIDDSKNLGKIEISNLTVSPL